jgi:hypothetical protein
MPGADLHFSLWGALLIGLVVGYLGGMLGVGGGFIANPLLNGILGIPMPLVSGTSLCQISGTSLSGLLRHRRHGQFDFRVAVILLGGVFCGEEAGVQLVEWLKGLGAVEVAGRPCLWSELILRGAFLALLVLIGLLVFFESRGAGRAAARGQAAQPCGWLARVKLPPMVRPVGGAPVPVVLLACVGLPIGLAQGLLGIGGGVLLLPTLVYVVGVSTHAAVGTDLMVVLAGSLWGTFRHALNGNVSLELAAALLAASTFGSQLGALTSTRLKAHHLRQYFALVVAAAAVILAWKLLEMFGVQITWADIARNLTEHYQ